MTLLFGAFTFVIGLIYLIMGLSGGMAHDRSGRVLARRRGEPRRYWALMVLYAAMTAMGAVIIAIGANWI